MHQPVPGGHALEGLASVVFGDSALQWCSQAMNGTVGPVLPCTSLRLEAVPEMNYDPSADPPRGEVCLQGPTLFSGYYKDEKKTAEARS